MSMQDKNNGPSRLQKTAICGAVAVTLGGSAFGISKYIETKNDLHVTQQELIQAELEKNELSDELSSAVEELTGLNDVLETYRIEKEELGSFIEELETNNAELQSENATLGKNIAALRTSIANLEAAQANNSNINISQSDIKLLAQVVHHESLGEPREGQLAVVNTLLNRLNDDRFPNTIHEIVYQPRQISHVHLVPTLPILDEHIAVVKEAVNGPDNTGGALFWFNPNIAACGWQWSRQGTVTIGGHRFSR